MFTHPRSNPAEHILPGGRDLAADGRKECQTGLSWYMGGETPFAALRMFESSPCYGGRPHS